MGVPTVPTLMEILKKIMAVGENSEFSNALIKKKMESMEDAAYQRGIEELERDSLLNEQFDKREVIYASSSDGESLRDTDPRIKLADLLHFIYEKLVSALKIQAAADPNSLIYELSIGHHNIFTKSLDFFYLSGIAPYVPDGIGIPLEQRSTHIKFWKRNVEDKDFQIKQLHSMLSVIFDLSDVSSQIKQSIIQKYLPDVIIAAEVLHHLGDASLHTRYSAMMEGLPTTTVIHTITALMRVREKECGWFAMSMGARMSAITARRDGGLADVLRAYAEMGAHSPGGRVLESLPFLRTLTRQIATCPGTIPRRKYYTSITEQLFEFLVTDSAPHRDAAVRIFLLFIDEMDKKMPKLTNELIYDRVFGGIEALLTPSTSSSPSRSFGESLHLLSALCRDEKMSSRGVVENERMRKLTPLLLTLASSPHLVEEAERGSEDGRSMREDLMRAARAGVERSGSKVSFVMWLIRQARSLRAVEWREVKGYVHPMIQIIEDTPSTASSSSISHPYGPLTPALRAVEEGECTERLVEVVRTVMEMEDSTPEEAGSLAVSLLLEIFMTRAKDERRMTMVEEEEIRLFHLNLYAVADGVLLERMSEQLFDHIDNGEMFKKLLSLIELTLASTVEQVQAEAKRQEGGESADYIMLSSPSTSHGHGGIGGEELEEDLERLACQTARLGIAVVKTVPAMGKMMGGEMFASVSSQMDRITRLISILKGALGELKRLPEKWRRMGEELSVESTIAPSAGSVKEVEETESIHLDDLLDLLTSSLPHERGHGLVRVGGLMRKRNREMMRIYGEKLEKLVMGLVADDDSYVFLAAINCAAEAALAMTDRVLQLVRLFANTVSTEERKGENGEITKVSIDDKVALRGKIAAVIVRVFKGLGTAAASYVADTAEILMGCLNDEDAIVRTCVYSCIADVCGACGLALDVVRVDILSCIKNTLTLDKEPIVRRSAMQVLEWVLRGAERNLVYYLENHLLTLNRLLNDVLARERDEIVLLHAQLAKESLNEMMREKIRKEGEFGGRRM